MKIVSGGQTGADRAALEFAVENGIEHGGWCPFGRKAEDGPINARYNLTETTSPDYIVRTELNAKDSDGTAIFSISKELTGGSKRTVELAKKHGKPVLHLSKERDGLVASELLRRFIEENKIESLNIAGPRASKEPDVAGFVLKTLEAALL